MVFRSFQLLLIVVDETGFQSRFRMPSEGTGVHYYSFAYGSLYLICLSAEDDYAVDSIQRQWLEGVLQYANTVRDQHLWLVVFVHTEMYASTGESPNEWMRQSFEPLFHQYGVGKDNTLEGIQTPNRPGCGWLQSLLRAHEACQ